MKLALVVAGIAGLAAGCAPSTRVTLLPQAEGQPSAVEVTAHKNTSVLSRPYESAAVGSRVVDVEQLDAAQVKKRYGTLLSVQPAEAERFMLHFMPGGSTLTAESNNRLADVLSRATSRPGGEIVVIGHTDRVGTAESNDVLSLRRAQSVRALVVQKGFDPSRVNAVGRGEREPVVPTADEVDEPQNRRVEIIVR